MKPFLAPLDDRRAANFADARRAFEDFTAKGLGLIEAIQIALVD